MQFSESRYGSSSSDGFQYACFDMSDSDFNITWISCSLTCTINSILNNRVYFLPFSVNFKYVFINVVSKVFCSDLPSLKTCTLSTDGSDLISKFKIPHVSSLSLNGQYRRLEKIKSVVVFTKPCRTLTSSTILTVISTRRGHLWIHGKS
jgi:hypothetical protein